MKSKETKTRTPALYRSFSNPFGALRHNVSQQTSSPQWQTVPLGLPVVDTCTCHHWSGLPRSHCRSPSLHSATATASGSQTPPSLVSASSGSTGVSSHYSGFNSAIYATRNPPPSQPQSEIHSLLDASYTTLVWDVRVLPKEFKISRQETPLVGPNALSFPLTQAATGHVRIISQDFPWIIEIGPKQRGITAGEVLLALYELLNGRLDDFIWNVSDDHTRSRIVRAWKSRSDSGPVIKRVDFLGKRFIFKGLYRDEKYVQQNQRPDEASIPEIFLVAFAKA
ncbi:uncharacterized protein FOMMEDRAFT_156435 [Fomitiporia mediterranea MF3/22]|uniref:uncharacterized protein n=1 Tax=Fomitiporia mediterranea (strain MF3/22) TaxID=694068 RepID=UPI000440991D|nr:uncharacterized protein FOMMEDRAFT_156435 [Fomitiporia mediterranea MF3/22]EJD03067.1 hypothetical protein FOMMEDRAFT_156435 [Fomitiporia mediterranea MF3/22]